MADLYTVPKDKLDAIANSIRSKTGKSDTMDIDEMPVEIESISGGGDSNISNLNLRIVTYEEV